VDGIETFALYDAVFEIDADNPEVQEALDVLTKLTVVFGISTLEIQTDRGNSTRTTLTPSKRSTRRLQVRRA